jgi:hypothetical protein
VGMHSAPTQGSLLTLLRYLARLPLERKSVIVESG